MFKKKKKTICPKSRSLSSPHQMTCVTRERQNSNKQYSTYLWLLLLLDGFILCVTLHATKPSSCCSCFSTKTLFLSVIYSITDTNNISPWRKDVNKGICIILQCYCLIGLKCSMGCCSVDPYLSNETGIYSSGCVCDSILHEAGMYGFFIMVVLMCTAHTNLANTCFPSKNSDLSLILGLNLQNDI